MQIEPFVPTTVLYTSYSPHCGGGCRFVQIEREAGIVLSGSRVRAGKTVSVEYELTEESERELEILLAAIRFETPGLSTAGRTVEPPTVRLTFRSEAVELSLDDPRGKGVGASIRFLGDFGS